MRVKVIEVKGQNSLIEWVETDPELQYYRVWIPSSVLEEQEDGTECTIDPTEGIPYGMPWEEIIGVEEITPTQISAQLRRHGIWTLDDFIRNHMAVNSAFAACYGINSRAIIAAANQFLEES